MERKTVRYQTALAPKAASSPIVPQPKEAKSKTKKAALNHFLKILIMNCQSIKNKKAEIHAVIDSAKPYDKILIGCLLILSAQGLLENSAGQVNQLRDIPSFYDVIGETVRKSNCGRYRLQLFVYWEKHIRTA